MGDSGGKKANKAGDDLRKTIAAMLLTDGYLEIGPLRPEPSRVPVLQAFERERLGNLERPEKCFASDVPACYSIFNLLYEAHYILRAKDWPSPLFLMALGQQSSGSAVHKLPYMFDNLREPMPGRSLVVIDLNVREVGADLARGVFLWAERQISLSRGRIACVFRGLTAFRGWLSAGSPYPPEPAQLTL